MNPLKDINQKIILLHNQGEKPQNSEDPLIMMIIHLLMSDGKIVKPLAQ